MVLIDTHTHIFGESFENDLKETIERAISVGVETYLVPNVDASSLSQVIQTIQSFPQALPMWGLHPCSVKGNWKEEWHKIEPFIKEHPPIAIGEIGLDFYWSTDFKAEQIEALNHQLNLAADLSLPVSLHTREATKDTIEIVKPFVSKGLKGVFHCFSGTEAEANQIVEMGFCIGIGGTITFKNNPMRNWIKNLPAEFLVLETDAPYLAPVPFRGKRNEPSYLIEIATELSHLLGQNPTLIGNLTTQNAHRIFRLSK